MSKNAQWNIGATKGLVEHVGSAVPDHTESRNRPLRATLQTRSCEKHQLASKLDAIVQSVRKR